MGDLSRDGSSPSCGTTQSVLSLFRARIKLARSSYLGASPGKNLWSYSIIKGYFRWSVFRFIKFSGRLPLNNQFLKGTRA